MKLPIFPALLGAALLLASSTPAAQRMVATGHGPGVRVSAYSSYTHAPRRVWVPGRYESRCEQIFVPGWNERVWVEPVFEFRLGSCGKRLRVEVCAGHWKTVHHPGHYETREFRVWVPGHYEVRTRCD